MHPRKKNFKRINWIDWMKAIGITLITYGHFFSVFDIYIYVFNVPLFFLISGFLCNIESDSLVFWKKVFYNLAIPLLIICTINYLINALLFIFGYVAKSENVFLFYFKLIIGMQCSLKGMWFVYTLIILKIILQYLKQSYVHFILFIVFLLFAYFINNIHIEVLGRYPFEYSCAIPNTFVAYPFFIIGFYLKQWKEIFINYKTNKYTYFFIFLCLLIVYFCGHNHKYVFLYLCGYGDNILLFIIGGLVGSMLVYFVSKLLEKYLFNFIVDISIGTTIILGFHMHIIWLVRLFIKQPSIADFPLSIFIVMTFVPIIRFCILHVPIIVGKYRIK